MNRRLRRQFAAPALLALGLSGQVLAAQMEDGQAAYDRGDYATALQLWRPLAEQGNARAQNNLGVIYENAKGVPQDLNEAIKWYRLAAEQGYAGAQNNLGLIYAIGRGGVRNDQIRAYMWFSLAASSLTGDVGKTVSGTRDVFATAMTSQQIALATSMARRCQESKYKECGFGNDAAAFDASAPAARTTTPAIATTSHVVTASDYPPQSIRVSEPGATTGSMSGTVTLTSVISENGSVTRCAILLSSGNPRLDQSACTMVKRRWKYKPATEDGKPVSIQYISKIDFPPR